MTKTDDARHRHITVLTGPILGILALQTSIAAGAVSAGINVYIHRYRLRNIVGSDLAHAVPQTAVAGLVHMHNGSVDYNLMGALLPRSPPDIYLGSQMSGLLPEQLLRTMLTCLLMLTGSSMMMASKDCDRSTMVTGCTGNYR